MRIVLAVVLALFLCSGFGLAQSKTTATLAGNITDASNALVPGAKITVSSPETGLTRDAFSESQGEYRVLLLPPGVYDIRVQKDGFTAMIKKGVELTVGQSANLDFQLAVGVSTQIIEVGTEAPAVETERTQQSDTIGQESVRNLPINRRDYLTFSLLSPGVADSKALADANSFRVKQAPDSGISFYGSNGRGNSISVDGGEANDSGGGVRPTVSQEAVQEFQINRTNYSAEYGSARGGVINIVTKSGTNETHGSAFGFFRREVLDAADPFAIVLQGNQLNRVKPPSDRQQFGATIGGPITKDKTFYFVGYEQLRRRESAAVPVLTDTSIFGPTPDQQKILAGLPAAAAAQLRAALSSPQSTIDMFEKNSGVFPFETDSHMGLIRLDHSFDLRNQLSFRYNVTRLYETNQNLKGLVGVSRGFITDKLDSTVLANWTHTFSSTAINELRAQFNYYDALNASNDQYGPGLDINGFGFFNRDIFLPDDSITRREDIGDNVSLFRGAHSLRFGGQLLIRNNRTASSTFFAGRFGFGSLPGSLVSPALATTTITALQAFNLGLPQSYQQGFGDPVVKSNAPLYAGYVQDTWKPRSNLTLNLGVRYEVDMRKSPLPTDRNNVAPRFGFAWDPWGDHKTTIRGGYGIFFAPIDFQVDYVVNALNEIDGVRQIAQVLSPLSAANPLASNGPINIFQTLRKQGVIGVPTPTRSITPDDLRQFGINISRTGPRPPLTVLFQNTPDYQNPYGQQASFGLEREIAPNFSVSAGYVFARGARITRSRDQNLLPAPINPALGIRYWGATPENPTGTKYFKDPLLYQDNLYESTANSFYHGLILEATRRLGRGISFHGNYTFSKAIDEVLDFNSDFQPTDQTNLRAERALSAFDQRHKVVLYAVLGAPRAGRDSNAWSKVFGDFLFTPIFRANSARPFNLLVGADVNGDRHSTTDRPPFAGRNTGIGPGFWTFDTRLSRRFHTSERASIELMAEAFNLFNHLNFACVNNTVGLTLGQGPFNVHPRNDRGPSDPLGYTAAFDPRRIQLGLRFSF